MKYYLAIKKNEILPFAITWMELESIMLSEISQTNICLTHKRNLRYKTDEQGKGSKNNIKTGRGTKYKRLLNMENNRGLLEGLREEGWTKWVRGIKESTPEIIVALYAN